MFERTLPNGQICDRLWLLYSPSQGSVFCFMCKLFSKNRENSFVKNGFDQWKKFEKISYHENSMYHREANTTWLLRENSLNSVNQQICKQISTETQYWIDVLKRVVAVIKYLSSRGLPFRGDNEVFGVKNNGNYLGLLELISEFDPFLKTHIELHGNKGRGHPSYLSTTILNELITLIKRRVINYIENEIRESKYFSLILDSTPDLSKVDQMAIVLRYCTSHNVQERLLELKPIDSHKGESIFKLLEDFLKNSKLDILNCRGQSYDNAPNMSGTYEGLQAYVKKKCDLAIYVPCTAHSLNLVGVHSVNCCLEAVNFFGFLQSLYNFFSSATHRWNILTTSIEKSDSNRLLVLKSLSDTRWSCHTESCKALINNYTKIIEVLETIISPNSKENEDTKRNARPLLKKILKKETGYMALLWNDILERSNKTSIQLQTINCDPLKALNLLISLKHYVSNLRKCSTLYENKINQLSPKIKEKYSDEQERIKKKKFPNDSGCNQVSLSGHDKFRVETYYVIIDSFCSQLEKRIEAYSFLKNNFLFITKLHVVLPQDTDEEEEVNKSLENFILLYKKDVDNTIQNEIIQFKKYWSISKPSYDDTQDYLLDIWKHFNEKNLLLSFPNLYTAIKIYLTIPIANCSAERAFSKLARIKNKYRTSSSQENLNSFMVLCSESDVLEVINTDDIIKEFAAQKSRKKYF